MKRATVSVLFCVGGIFVGLIFGFILANSLNRAPLVSSAPSIANSSASATAAVSNANQNELSETEIRRAIEGADASSDDDKVQLQIGMALYGYAKSRQDIGYLNDLERILKRAEKRNSDNFELLMALGEIEFVRGQETKQTQFYNDARAYFQKAFKLKPDNVDALVNLAATFLFAAPPEPAKAIPFIEKSLRLEPRNELVNIYLINALILENRLEEAARQIENLQKINPQNSVLPDLRAQLAQKKQTQTATKQ